MKIRGNTVGNLAPRSNWNQSDPTKADYIIGKEYVDEAIEHAQQTADAPKHSAVAVTLPVSGWANLAQTVSVEGVTADNDVIMSYSKESREAANDAEIYLDAQSEGKLTFVCATAPKNDITVNVMIFK